ncbi:MAG: isopeptide-forming domain-containing fimbrial protein [Clostridia bacterium]|nr:isopeptide-forming domain-containing fimbrial protein [Clostridia bacterium]
MKKTSKLTAVLLSLVLVVFLPLAGNAAGTTYTLTLNNPGETTHQFQVYQIFIGDLYVNGSGERVLSNIEWGNGVTAGGKVFFGNAVEKAETLKTEADGKAFADQLVSVGYLTNPVQKTVAANSTETIANLEPGYYLIKDAGNSQNMENGVYTAYILEVVGDITASAKIDVPTVEKKAKDINDTLDDDISDNPWQDSVDYDIGDTIPYQIVGTLPTNYAEYDQYYYKFTDNMCAGLTYQDDAKVYIDNAGVETEITSQVSINSSVSNSDTTLEITISNLDNITGVSINKDSKIVVRYTAVLNQNAVSGSAGNENTVFLTYSNNPNAGGVETANTPVNKTVVFTYKLQINKVDENNSPLQNAGFTLYKKDSSGAWQTVKTIVAGSETQFTFAGLDDGDYKLVESEVPQGYNKFEDLEFNISAEHTSDSQTPTLVSINNATTEGETITLQGSKLATVSLASGTISTTIMNKSGSLLPSTGGIGTTIFYIVGAVLVICGIIFLIAKKSMKYEE